jgi:hypothetical protein
MPWSRSKDDEPVGREKFRFKACCVCGIIILRKDNLHLINNKTYCTQHAPVENDNAAE